MNAGRELREKALTVTAVGRAISETAKAVKAEASAAAATPNQPQGVSDGRSDHS